MSFPFFSSCISSFDYLFFFLPGTFVSRLIQGFPGMNPDILGKGGVKPGFYCRITDTSPLIPLI